MTEESTKGIIDNNTSYQRIDHNRSYSIDEAMPLILPKMDKDSLEYLFDVKSGHFATTESIGPRYSEHRLGESQDNFENPRIFVEMNDYFRHLEMGIKSPETQLDNLHSKLSQMGKDVWREEWGWEHDVSHWLYKSRDRLLETEKRPKAFYLVGLGDHSSIYWKSEEDLIPFVKDNIAPLFKSNKNIKRRSLTHRFSLPFLEKGTNNENEWPLFTAVVPYWGGETDGGELDDGLFKYTQDSISFNASEIPCGNIEANLAYLNGLREVVDVLKTAPGMREIYINAGDYSCMTPVEVVS